MCGEKRRNNCFAVLMKQIAVKKNSIMSHHFLSTGNSFESSVDENTTNDIYDDAYDSSEETETTTIKLITTSTSTTITPTTKEDDHDEDYTDPNSDSSPEEDLTTLVQTTESSTTTTSTTQPSSTVRQYLPVQSSLPGMQPTIPSSTTKSSRIEGSGSGKTKLVFVNV